MPFWEKIKKADFVRQKIDELKKKIEEVTHNLTLLQPNVAIPPQLLP
jgi:hypothetical protein